MLFAGIPAVVNLMAMEDAGSVWHRGSFIPVAEACQMLEAAGADVVGLNCHRGPKTMLPVIKEVKKAVQVSTQKRICCTIWDDLTYFNTEN